MTKDQQTRFANVMAGLMALYPQWRIGQLIANVAWWARGPNNEAIWDVEDDEFLAAAEAHLARRQAEAGSSSCEGRPVSRAG